MEIRAFWIVALASLPNAVWGQEVDRLVALENRVATLEERLGVDQLMVDLYENIRPSVVRIHSGLAHGTGFFVRTPDTRYQYLLTNDHVINDPTRISVLVDSTTHVRAQLVASDPTADLAVLRIQPACDACPSLPLADRPYLDSALAPGRRIFAVGFPLHQARTLTSGIVGSVTSSAVMSDVVLNPGNSGGPLLTTDGIVIAVNTFVDQGPVGPGVAGSVLATGAAPLLGPAITAPPDSLLALGNLPVIQGSYPIDVLQRVALRDSTPDVYNDFAAIDANRFAVTVLTPTAHSILASAFERRIAKDRRRREERAGIPTASQYRGVAEYRDWLEHVGEVTRPAVSIQVTPKIGETSGSIARGILTGFANAMSKTYSARDVTIRFRGDVWEVAIYKSGVRVEPYIGGVRPIRMNQTTRLLNMQDVATEGIYILPPEVFEPDVGGLPAGVSLQITDLKNRDSTWVHIPDNVSLQIWNDFIPYFEAATGHADVRRAQIVRDYDGIGMQFDHRYSSLARPIMMAADAVGHQLVTQISDIDRMVMYFRPTGSLTRIRVIIESAGVRRSNVWVATEDGDEESKLLAETIREAVDAMR